MSGRGPLLIIEKEDDFHARFSQLIDPGRPYRVIKGTVNLRSYVIHDRRRGLVSIGNDVPGGRKLEI
jgi:hypothetical protein